MAVEEPTKCSCGETTEEALLAQLDTLLEDYVGQPGALIPALQLTQGLFGYLPEEALKKISRLLGKSYSEVAGVVSFYSFFSTVPRGKYLVRVCLGTACYVRGAKQVLEALKSHLNIEVGETTSDRLFSLDIGRCFGACGLAPAVMVNDDTHRRVRPAKVGQIIAEYRKQEALEAAAKPGTDSPPSTAPQSASTDFEPADGQPGLLPEGGCQ